MQFTVINCCPVPADGGFAGVVGTVLHESGATLASAYRGSDPNAAKYLTGQAPCYKHTQAYLYNGWVRHLPGFNPANPPGYSTHECFNDGVAYPVARGAELAPWQCGLDIDDAHVSAFCSTARKHNWIVTVTYPGDPREYHHVNFRQRPSRIIVTRRGDSGPKVRKLQRQLAFIERPNKPGVTYLKDGQIDGDFGRTTEAAVKLFQADHHQTADGAVGPHTRAQLEVAEKNERRRHKIDHLKIKLHNAEDALANAHTDAQRRQQHARVEKLKKQIRELGGKP